MAKDTTDGANDIVIHMIFRLNPLVRETLDSMTPARPFVSTGETLLPGKYYLHILLYYDES